MAAAAMSRCSSAPPRQSFGTSLDARGRYGAQIARATSFIKTPVGRTVIGAINSIHDYEFWKERRVSTKRFICAFALGDRGT